MTVAGNATARWLVAVPAITSKKHTRERDVATRWWSALVYMASNYYRHTHPNMHTNQRNYPQNGQRSGNLSANCRKSAQIGTSERIEDITCGYTMEERSGLHGITLLIDTHTQICTRTSASIRKMAKEVET